MRLFLLELLVIAIGILGAQIHHIQPDRVVILSVLDVSSDEIARDFFTLLRSIRLFGGTMNLSPIMVAVVPVKEDPSKTGALVQQLLEYKVEIAFISVLEGVSKTMNKFIAMELFDPIRFDYLLWLDADVVVLDDPFQKLSKHEFPGRIDCVPELYSYMRRYPKINTSTSLWNPKLGEFILIGEGESAPHGTCNTGVLFIDSAAISTLLSGIKKILSPGSSYLEVYGRDRFFDSLIFVAAVNLEGIAVNPLGFDMNFMAFFEVEILEDTATDSITFLHLLSDTKLLFEASFISHTAQADCNCMYENEHIPEYSLIVQYINKMLLPMENCLAMAGVNTAKIFQVLTVDIDKESFHCSLLWPLSNKAGLTRIILSNMYVSHIYLVLSCSSNYSQQMGTWSEIRILLVPFVNEEPCHLQDNFVMNEETDYRIAIHPIEKTNISTAIYRLVIPTDKHLPPDVLPSLNFCLLIAVDLKANDNSTIAEFRMTEKIQLALPEKRNSISYMKSAFDGSAISLESQIFLPEYLNFRQNIGIAIVYCCDTTKGLAVLKRLVSEWHGSHILIDVNRIPATYSGSSSSEFLAEILSECSFSKITCITTVDLLNLERKLSIRLKPSLVYIDIYDSYQEYIRLLSWWTAQLTTGGMIVGSRFSWSSIPRIPYKSNDTNTSKILKQNAICPKSDEWHLLGSGKKNEVWRDQDGNRAQYYLRDAVEDFSFNSKKNILLTYAEEIWCISESKWEVCTECSPAWYIINNNY